MNADGRRYTPVKSIPATEDTEVMENRADSGIALTSVHVARALCGKCVQVLILILSAFIGAHRRFPGVILHGF